MQTGSKKSNLGAFSDAVRLLQADHYVEATYKMLGAFRRGPDLNAVAMTQLDALAGVIIETWWRDLWLDGKETATMTDTTMRTKPEEDGYLRTYRDVLALTGLIEPFIRHVRNTPTGTERELKKLIEHVENDVAEFCYDLAQALTPFGKAIPSTRMFDGRGTHTIVGEALRLLNEAEIDVAKPSSTASSAGDKGDQTGTDAQGDAIEQSDAAASSDGNDPPELETETHGQAYSINIDMLQGVYLHLYRERYHTPKQRRDLAYQLKLSLYARFPRLVSNAGKSNDNA